jgi:hypothetical protein
MGVVIRVGVRLMECFVEWLVPAGEEGFADS